MAVALHHSVETRYDIHLLKALPLALVPLHSLPLMKAERRHELQQNSLARFFDNLPVMLRLYADRILLVVVVIILIGVLIQWRMNSAAARSLAVANDLAVAKSAVKQLSLLPGSGPVDEIAQMRQRSMDEFNASIDSLATNAADADAALQSQALLARGDFYWTLSRSPELPGATTRPALKLAKTSADYLSLSEEAYQQLLKTYPEQKEAVVAAEFGLAGIAENKHDWEQAAKWYDQIKQGSPNAIYKDLAEARAKLLSEIKVPLLLSSNTPVAASPLIFAPPTTQSVAATQAAPSTQSALAAPSPATGAAATQP